MKYRNRYYYKYNGPLRTENFLAFANKLINPIIELKVKLRLKTSSKKLGKS